jgi:glycerol-3-phosphate acyltransferase PlsY
MTITIGLASLLLAYILGALPFGYWLVRLRRGDDVRESGSGATGATNVTRTAGWKLGLPTLALDVAKGYAAVALAAQLSGENSGWMAAAAVVAIIGHSFPVFLGFRGGKSVAPGLGAFLYFTPLGVAAALGVWLVVVGLWRYVALGSVLAAGTYPVFAYLIYHPPLSIRLAAVAGACIIILRHRSNLERLVKGTESRLLD